MDPPEKIEALIVEEEKENQSVPNLAPWEDQIREKTAKEKILVRRALEKWDEVTPAFVLGDAEPHYYKDYEDADTPVPQDPICILSAPSKKPDDSTDFYKKITPHMTEALYWIDYASYATGDLSSLAAAVINDPRHGISMFWDQIGEPDPGKNMEILRSFLGGEKDPEEGPCYVVTQDGAKGRWGEKSEHAYVKYEDLTKDEVLSATLFDAACQYLDAGKELHGLNLEQKDNPKADNAVESFSIAARTLAEVSEHPDQAQKWINAREQGLQAMWAAGGFVTSRWRNKYRKPVFFMLKKVDVKGGAQTTIAKEFRQGMADELWDGACWARDAIGCFQEEQGLSYRTQSHMQSEGINRPYFTDGTNMVAMGWNAEKKARVREAWGVEEKYDAGVEAWLSEQNIPLGAIQGKNVVVLWIRKSGERGGAHFENDTGFRELKKCAQTYVENGCTVFLAGDDKLDSSGISRAEKIKDEIQGVYNITQFWNKPSDKLNAWCVGGRVGQFRLYDYLNRNAGCLKHVGPMSGNMEAMSLLGHKVEVLAQSPRASGVKRMLAYTVHDQGSTDEDKLSYDFTLRSDKESGLPPYGKKAIRYYMELSCRSNAVYTLVKPKELLQLIDLSPLLSKKRPPVQKREQKAGSSTAKVRGKKFVRTEEETGCEQIKAALLHGLVLNRDINELLTELADNASRPIQTVLQKFTDETRNQLARDYDTLKKTMEEMAVNLSQRYFNLIKKPMRTFSSGKQEEQLINHIIIRAAKLVSKNLKE